MTEIAENAFGINSTITSISVPKSVRLIGEGAFAGCTALKTLTLPSMNRPFDGSIFYTKNGIEVNYNGTKKVWEGLNMKIIDSFNDRYTVHCTDGDYLPVVGG